MDTNDRPEPALPTDVAVAGEPMAMPGGRDDGKRTSMPGSAANSAAEVPRSIRHDPDRRPD